MMKNALVALFVVLVSGCSDPCDNSTISTVSAPVGDLKASLFQRDCGATTGFSSQVSVLDANDAPTEGGNAFVADTDNGVAKAASWGGPWVELEWLGPQRLIIRYDAKARVFKQNKNVSGVSISYQKI
jgi:hypothetical protein